MLAVLGGAAIAAGAALPLTGCHDVVCTTEARYHGLIVEATFDDGRRLPDGNYAVRATVDDSTIERAFSIQGGVIDCGDENVGVWGLCEVSAQPPEADGATLALGRGGDTDGQTGALEILLFYVPGGHAPPARASVRLLLEDQLLGYENYRPEYDDVRADTRCGQEQVATEELLLVPP